MKKCTRLILVLLFSSVTFACKKEKVTKNHPELLGNWIEHSSDKAYHKLYIENESKGTLYECTRGASGDCADTQFRKWRIKNNHLFYGIANDLGEILLYPTTATSDILFGTNDTIKAGEKYIILNHYYWTAE